jgi:hypothetical protein
MSIPYRLRWQAPGVIDLRDGATIPSDPESGRWREYLTWMYAGNEPLPALEPPPLPKPYLSKFDLIRRMTEGEVAAIAAAREHVTAKENMLWEAAPPMLDTDDVMLRGFLTPILGAERVEELLSVEGL